MILVLERGTTEEEQQAVLAALRDLGLEGRILGNLRKPVVHVVNRPTWKARKLLSMDRVETLIPTSGPRIRREGRRFYPYHFINWSSAAIVVVGLLVVLTGFLPPGVGAEIDPHSPPVDVEPPWYLIAPLAVVRLAPERWMGWLLLLVLFLLVYFLPRLDRSRGATLYSRLPVVLFGLAVVVLWSALTVRGILA